MLSVTLITVGKLKEKFYVSAMAEYAKRLSAYCRFEVVEVKDEKIELSPAKTVIYLILFALSIVIVFRIIPYWIGLIVIPAALLVMDRKALKMVDYPLLLTFVFFFVFSGNMARIDAVRNLFSALLEKSTLLVSVISCQFISNVPSAILLSQFTENYRDLLLGVNIGGTGTAYASNTPNKFAHSGKSLTVKLNPNAYSDPLDVYDLSAVNANYIKNTSKNPNSGDTILSVVAVAWISACGLIVTVAMRKKRIGK